jgi:hypothetical protein
MPSVNIPDEMFEQLAKRARALNVTVEQLIAPLLDLAAGSYSNELGMPTLSPAPFDDWKKKFDAWMAEVEARAHRYPPGFVLDDSRESMYEGCGQ